LGAFGLPELRHAPRHTVAIDAYVWGAINMEIGSGLEAGGVLLGTRAPMGRSLLAKRQARAGRSGRPTRSATT
jgi:hypothetical protein